MDVLLEETDNESTLSEKKVRFSLPAIMKEQTYGWYPSAKDVYVDRRMGAPNTYQLEAMYKFQNSKYYSSLTPPSPRPPRGFRPTPTPTKRPVSSVSSHHSHSGHHQSSLQVRAKSAPIYDFKPVPKLQIPTPFQCWSTKVPETPYGIPLELEPGTPSPPSVIDSVVEVPVVPYCETPVNAEQESFVSKKERVKSAVIPRQKPSPPPRPIKSAGPGRQDTPSDDIRRPRNPTPIKSCDYAETLSRVATPEQYERDREKYGWRAEVHGDPLRLKKISKLKVMKRLPYYVTCDEPIIQPDPPKIHMENMETFFYNTIPRRPMAYTIHKEWVSEVIHAKRMELQKREGIKHRWKNFAFVY